jgi:integrase
MARPRAETPTYSLAKREGGWFYVQWWDGDAGAARRVSCRTKNPAAARRFLTEFRVGASEEPAPETPTIGAILDGYKAAREKKRHSKTLGYDVAALKRHLADMPADLMNEKQSEIYGEARRAEPPRIASAKYRKAPKPLSDGTLIRELGTLRTAFTWAEREKWIATKPYVARPSAPPSRERWLTRDEYDVLLKAATAPHVRLFIALGVHTGGRMSALLELTWDRVNLKTREINLGIGWGKKKRARPPISDDLLTELTVAAEVATSDYVIEYGGARIANAGAGVRAAARRAGIKDVTPHVFRHTAATWMVQRNVSFSLAARYLGTTEAMIEKVYGHHSPEWLKQAMAAFSRQTNEETKQVDRA